jgi:hypothetical protein
METIHSVAEPDKNVKKILKDGFLRPSAETKNIKLFGKKPGSKYNFLKFQLEGDPSATFTFSPKFLLNKPFYLNLSWIGEPKGEPIVIKTLTELKKLKNYVEKNQNKKESIMMSHEILFEFNIDLHKYLIKAVVPKKILEYAKNKYPNVKFTTF